MIITQRFRRVLDPRPVPPLLVIIPATAVFVVSVLTSWSSATARYPQWVSTSAVFHEQLILLGPVAVASGAYWAVTMSAPNSLLALPSALRGGLPVVVRLCGLLVAWLVAAFLAGMAPLLVVTALRATAGGPHLMVMLVGVLGLVASVVIGFLAGIVWPRILVVPVSAVGAFVLLLVPTEVLRLQAVSPYLGTLPVAGLVQNPPVVLFKAVFLGTLVVAAVIVGAAVLRHRRRLRHVAAGVVVVASVPVLLAVVPLVRPATVIAAEPTLHSVCDETLDVPVCVHAAYRNDLPQVVAIAAQLIDTIGAPPAVSLIVDSALTDRGQLPPRGEAWIFLSPDSDPQRDVPGDIARAMTGVGACVDRADPRAGVNGVDQQREDYALRLSNWLLDRSGFAATSSRSVISDTAEGGEVIIDEFGDVDPAVVRGWIVEQSQQLVTCSVPEDQIR